MSFELKIPLNTLRHVETEPHKSQVPPTRVDGSEEITINTEGEEIMRAVGSLYPDPALWGVSYVSISATGAPPPDPFKDARKNTRRKSSLRRAAAATVRLLGFSRSRSSYKTNRTGKASGNDKRASSYP
ncbi:hypothetical protein Clacol_002926 [Clathrus columnatus]|uniref:Uncharacterized protein n=1 Tax=Clathrus columnatus TaxID=1419009 RepID=A0AAV5A4Y8_9AGAM|nr:hypothetical protein Clacol_002926 [Clathrus columnatus]